VRILALTNLYPTPVQPGRAPFNRQLLRALTPRHAGLATEMTPTPSDWTTISNNPAVVRQLGVIAIKMPGVKLAWDAPRMRFRNNAEANEFVKPAYRAGWTL
jgi:hypothetical protein